MSGIIRIFLAICLVLGGCTAISQPGGKLSTDKILLDQVNPLARNDPNWFSASEQGRKELAQKYKGKQSPGLAVYLENDIFLYADEELTKYLFQIIDRLLQGWEGVRPDLVAIVESGKFFSAYVDELHQLHVTTGLLRELENEDQLASVIAHELSHVLLRHNSEKSFAERAGSTLELGGILMASGGLYADSITGDHQYRQKGQEGLLGFQALGFVWADMLVPSWSRENEREADMMGLDLLIRANYNYEQFPNVIERIADAEIQRSERLEQYNKLAVALIERNKNNIKTSFGGKVDNVLQDMGVAVEKLFVEKVTSEVASLNKSHEERDQRIDALKTYLQVAHEGGDLPPDASTAFFDRIVGSTTAKARLKQDLAALEVIDALQEKNISLATSKFPEIKYKHRASPTSCCIAKSSLEISRKKIDMAVEALDGLVQNNASPAEAYIRLAELHASRHNYAKAEASLRRGVENIGRDYRFLPMLIRVNARAGNISAAEGLTLRCKQYDDNVLSSLGRFGFGEKQGKDTYYRKCAEILGYDVAKRRDEADATKPPASFGKALQRVLPFSR